ncbi:MAG: enoyl-CoA hydratase [Dehalococcoidia bacterium]|nr:enoyl-CoA hydratase [Dehalococcoidia bacterium]MQG15940.1 enoyl-CoA hydratase [SAR202 cluster bacterium]|tara:strand:+ start:17011 stop:17796 length:786 start_codon:yes stop_codon:yes gene_type:complete
MVKSILTKGILSERDTPVLVLSLTHSEKRNTLSLEKLIALSAEIANFASDPELRVLVIRADGPVFSAGHDLFEISNGTREDHLKLFEQCAETMEQIRKTPKPVIASVNGLATAAGCQLVATCDIAIASSDSQFATPGVNIGLFCTMPGVALSRAIPKKKALDMMLTGHPIDAEEAQSLGLISRVVQKDRLKDETYALAHEIANLSPSVISMGKQAFYQQIELNIETAYEFAKHEMVNNLEHPDAKEGISAFLTKRQPNWIR